MKIYNGNIMGVRKSNISQKKYLTCENKDFGYLIYEYFNTINKENATLIKLPNNRYIDLENVKSKLDLLKIYYSANQIDATSEIIFQDNRVMENEPTGIGSLFVDEDTLKEISKKETRKIICKL